MSDKIVPVATMYQQRQSGYRHTLVSQYNVFYKHKKYVRVTRRIAIQNNSKVELLQELAG